MTSLLRRWSAGENEAFDALMEAAYTRLYRIARHNFGKESDGHMLQATAILNEAVLQLMSLEGLSWSDRAHFYAVAARMMRRVLVDHARAQNRLKRGGAAVQVTLSEASEIAIDGRPPDLEALDSALAQLAARDPVKGRLVELRFFAGLSGREIGRCLGISPATVQREWQRARTWLFAALTGANIDG